MTRWSLDVALYALQQAEGTSGRHPNVDVRETTARRLLPYDDLAWALGYLASRWAGPATSTCALEGLAYLRAGGLEDEVLHRPYAPRIGQAVADVVRVAQAHGAWVTGDATLTEEPKVGDVYLVAPPEHVLTVVAVHPDGVIESVEGGQVDGTWTMRRRRKLWRSATRTYIVDFDKPFKDGGVPNGRAIVGRLVVARVG